MFQAHRGVRYLLAFSLLALQAGSAAHAERHDPAPSARKSFECYCACNAKDKKDECAKMCELPKYEPRWWATSCHKKPAKAPKQSSQPSRSRRDNGLENARRARAAAPKA